MSGWTAGNLRRVCPLLGVVLMLAVPAVAHAATVTNTNDSGAGSLRAAIANTPSGGTVDFAPGLSGTITLTGGVLSITQSVNIAGPGAGTITVNGNHNDTVFDIAPSIANQDVTISGLTITGGSATTNGGGILANDLLRTLTLSGDTITANRVTLSSTNAAGGGGVYVNGGTLVVAGSTITGNSVTLNGSASDSSGGGGLYDNGGSIMVSGSDVSNNTVAQSSSGGSSGGGGIYSNGNPVEVTASTVRNNTVTIQAGSGFDGGGGIYSNGGGVDVGDATIDGNSFTLAGGTGGDSGGGGVYENGGDVTIVTSSLDANTANVTDSGGGIEGGGGLFSNGGQIGVLDSSISTNTVSVDSGGDSNGGGGVYDDTGQGGIYITSTLSGNATTLTNPGVDNGGGAIRSSDSVLASNLTIAGNRINAAGGGIFNAGSLNLKNTIIADNGTDNCGGTGTFNSSGFNLESANTCHLNGTGDLVNTEPQLGPVQDNGGPTPTQALSSGSPAVDAGSCTDIIGNPLTTDQRGVARPQPAGGRCDIGAYELVPGSSPPPPPPPPAPAPPATVAGSAAATSSRDAGFSGSVNPEGQATTVFFQYGLDARYRPGGGTGIVYDQSTPPQSLPADTSSHAVSTSVAGLVPNALYHVRLVAVNATGTTFGPDQIFTTPADPAPPAPVLGKSVNAKPVSGQVFVLVGTKLVPLTESEQLPSGAVLDARAGSLQLTSAAPRARARQTGVFGGAIFKLTQARGGASRGVTTLALVEGAFAGAPSFGTCRAHRGADGHAAATSTLQLLHASAHGRFRTSGRYSAATVRGTRWTIADRCDGTLVHDITDSVAVKDFVRHRTVVLHAGQSYLARAPHRGHRK
jgi:hypothetical protein